MLEKEFNLFHGDIGFMSCHVISYVMSYVLCHMGCFRQQQHVFAAGGQKCNIQRAPISVLYLLQ